MKNLTPHHRVKGFTLIEILIAIASFAFVSLVASETIILSLRGTKKADTISKVRQNVDYALGVMDRQLRSAKSIASECNGSKTQDIRFIDQNNNPGGFSCSSSGIASASGTLTPAGIVITSCSFVCFPAGDSTPPSITIQVDASDETGQNAPVSATTQITLRGH